MTSDQPSLFGNSQPLQSSGEASNRLTLSDRDDRAYATDPRNHVVLEASAGTGKTSVLVDRYLSLLSAGVDPSHILALTFTRKAAAEMRDRVLTRLRTSSEQSDEDRARWIAIRERLGAVAIGTIDSFCLALVREFPLEADVEPGFAIADETEAPRIRDEALDRAMRRSIALASVDPDVALVFAQLGVRRAKAGLEHLLERRLAAPAALERFLVRAPVDLTVGAVCERGLERLRDLLEGSPGGLRQFVADGPLLRPRFQMLADDLLRLDQLSADGARVRGVIERVREHFLTQAGQPRERLAQPYRRTDFASARTAERHRRIVTSLAPAVANALEAFDRDLNVVLARGVGRMFRIARDSYISGLEARGSLDFTEILDRALRMLRRMDEFSQSRYRLESRYHHVLVDEFQDTNRAQWELVSLLVRAWEEGLGLAAEAKVPPSLFIVGDRKQSIYRFRDADAGLLSEAAEFVRRLRPDSRPRRVISHSFRATAELQQFTNDLFEVIGSPPDVDRPDAFCFREADRFPAGEAPDSADVGRPLGIVVAEDAEACAACVAAEIERLMAEASVRDQVTGVPRHVRPGDVAILFRSRESHREFDKALNARGLPSYVYRGLGFFDADEVKDLFSLIRYLADPSSNLRAAAFLRSRIVRLSDVALASLAPHVASALTERAAPPACAQWHADDQRAFAQVRSSLPEWLSRVDLVPPAELLDFILADCAYAFELNGPHVAQARENVKKLGGMIRRIQNRGYATFARISDHLQRLSAGDESNAVVDALDAVHLLTVHAAKGLEFPIVFLVNLTRGTGALQRSIHVQLGGDAGEPLVSVGRLSPVAAQEEARHDREETKRLLYVAATRARDSLYWSAVVEGATVTPGRGSLAEILPASFLAVLGDAARETLNQEWVEWRAPAERVYRLRVCRLPAGSATEATREPSPGWVDDLAPICSNIRGWRTSVSELVANVDGRDEPTAGRNAAELVGRLVHRLLQVASAEDIDPADLTRMGTARLRSDEEADAAARSLIVASAVEAFLVLRQRPDVRSLLDGHCLFEVPFSVRLPRSGETTVMRGTLDCLVRHSDGRLTVVEFKTGARRAQHESQLELYLTAARALFPSTPVDATLIYVR